MGNPNPTVPKRRRTKSISRHSRKKNKKTSNYDYDEARDSIGLPASASYSQVLSHTLQSGPNPPLPRSPPKHVVKAKLKEQQAENEVLSRDLDVAQRDLDAAQREVSQKAQKINNLKEQIRKLSQSLQDEKKKSRATIAQLLDDAEQIMSEACGVEHQADKKMSAAEQQVVREKERTKNNMQAAQQQVSLEKQRSKLKLQEERRRSASNLASG